MFESRFGDDLREQERGEDYGAAIGGGLARRRSATEPIFAPFPLVTTLRRAVVDVEEAAGPATNTVDALSAERVCVTMPTDPVEFRGVVRVMPDLGVAPSSVRTLPGSALRDRRQ